MLDVLQDFYQATSIIDIFYLIITIFSLIKCYKKGFVLSILEMSRWLFAYILTLIIFPKTKPYFSNGLINNIKEGSKVKTETIANNIAIPVKIPK